MDTESSEKLRKLNASPVNRKAREMLEQSGQRVPEDVLHCCSLAAWALENGLFDVDAAVSETVAAMVEWRPERLMNFLGMPATGLYDPPGWAQARDIRELACVIIDDIEEKIHKHFPFCGTTE